MHPIRLLSRTTARGVALNSQPGSGEHRKEASWALVSEYLAGLSSYETSYALWRFGSDDSQKKAIRNRLLAIAVARAKKNNSRIKMTTLLGIANSAIAQSSMPWCTKCNGTGEFINGELVVCSRCKGTGQVQLTIADIGRISGVDRRSIVESHREIYQFLLQVMSEWDFLVIDHIHKAMESNQE